MAAVPLVSTYEQVSPSNVRAHFAQPPPDRRRAKTLPLSVPRYVARCGRDALWTWERSNPALVQRTPHQCGSWRHEGPCARYSASVAFARIKEAVERPEFEATGWIFAVLTIDRNAFYGGRRWKDTAEAYRELSRMSRNFLTALRKRCKKNGWTNPGSNWVAVVEAHRSGWPHVNLMFYSHDLAFELEEDRVHRLAHGETARASVLVRGELGECLVQAGWGPQSTAERARSRDALAGYFVKLAGQAGSTSGELAKLTQAPLVAKQGFRRLRSGRGFLPPKRKNLAYTGTLIRRELNPLRSAYAAVPLVRIIDPEARAVSEACLPLEEDRMAREYRSKRLAEQTGLPIAEPRVEQWRDRGSGYELVGGIRGAPNPTVPKTPRSDRRESG